MTTTPIEYEVAGKAQLIAAVRAAAQPTELEALKCPVTIRLMDTSCKYFFKYGITESRAEDIARTINRTPARAFK